MADALVSFVIDQVASFIQDRVLEEARRVLGVDSEIEDLKERLLVIQPVLLDADKKQLHNNALKSWVDSLKDVTCDIEDVLSEWTTAVVKIRMERSLADEKNKKKKNKNKKVTCFISLSSCFGSDVGMLQRRNISLKIEGIKAKLVRVAQDKIYCTLSSNTNEVPEPNRPQTTSSPPAAVVGREKDMDEVVGKLLHDSDQGLHVVSISGMGGIGKTALAQLIHKYFDRMETGHFDLRMWVFVSHPFDQLRVAKAIAGGDVVLGTKALQHVLNLVQNMIRGKKFLLVLDDVCTEEHQMWQPLYNSLKDGGAPGSRILVTTRNEKVSKMMGSTYNHQLGNLSKKNGLHLFKRIASFGRTDYKKFEDIGDKIAEKCNGFPLAISTLANLVRGEPASKWNDVLEDDIWKYEDRESGASPAFLLSYFYLPAPVKRCFAYCANFPKDYKIEADNLIKLWMAQGYLSPKETEKMEKTGRDYLEVLAMRSFLQVLEKDEDTDTIKLFKMHDMVHDFANYLSTKESLIEADSSRIAQKMDENKRYRHLTLVRKEKAPFPACVCNTEKLHTFAVQSFHDCPPLVGETEVDRVPPKFFDHFDCVKALDLSHNRLCELPVEVGNMMNLRYLNLSHNPLSVLPQTVCDLFNLQTLKLSSCKHLRKLPQEMEKVINLRHLEIDGTESLKSLPKGIRRLISLRTLTKFLIGSDGDAEDGTCKLGDLENLNNLLGSLKIEGLGYVENEGQANKAKLKDKSHLVDLHMDFSAPELPEGTTPERITAVAEALQLHSGLQCLQISSYDGTRFPKWMVFLTSLTELRLQDCRNCQRLPQLGKLPALETLYIEHVDTVDTVGLEFLGVEKGGSSSTAFPSLKKLVLKNMSSWEKWDVNGSEPEKNENITIMPYLSYLRLSYCRKLKTVPVPVLKSVEKFLIHDCPIVKMQIEEKKIDISHIADPRIF